MIATLFAEMVGPFTRELDARGVPYVFVDSDIPACNRLAYFGTSSFDAGAVAARLLFDRLDPGAVIVVGRIVHRGDAGFEPVAQPRGGIPAVTSKRMPSGAGCTTPRCGWTTKPATAACWMRCSAKIRRLPGP